MVKEVKYCAYYTYHSLTSSIALYFLTVSLSKAYVSVVLKACSAPNWAKKIKKIIITNWKTNEANQSEVE